MAGIKSPLIEGAAAAGAGAGAGAGAVAIESLFAVTMTTFGDTLSYRCRCRAGVRRLAAGDAQDDTGDEHRRDERDDRRRALCVRQRQGQGDELGSYVGGQASAACCVLRAACPWSFVVAGCFRCLYRRLVKWWLTGDTQKRRPREEIDGPMGDEINRAV